MWRHTLITKSEQYVISSLKYNKILTLFITTKLRWDTEVQNGRKVIKESRQKKSRFLRYVDQNRRMTRRRKLDDVINNGMEVT